MRVRFFMLSKILIHSARLGRGERLQGHKLHKMEFHSYCNLLTFHHFSLWTKWPPCTVISVESQSYDSITLYASTHSEPEVQVVMSGSRVCAVCTQEIKLQVNMWRIENWDEIEINETL